MLPTLDRQVLQQKTVGDLYLKVLLKSDQAAVLPMGQAQEAIALPTRRVTPMPNMPACILGLLNHKSRVFWVVDLPLLLGLSAGVLNTQQYNIVIIRSGKTPLGLAVPEIQGVVRLASNAIQPAVGEIVPELAPYLQGCLMQSQEMLWVLDAKAIVHAPLLY